MIRISAVVRRLLAREDGTAVLEYAFVAAPFIGLLLAALQTSLVFFVQEALETSVETAARSVITGQAQTNDATGSGNGMTAAQLQARFQQAACATLPSFLSCSKLFVDVRSAVNWSNLDTSTPTITFDNNGNVTNTFSYSLGNSGSIVLVRLMYLWPVQTGPLGFNISNVAANTRMITATSVAKIENYTS